MRRLAFGRKEPLSRHSVTNTHPGNRLLYPGACILGRQADAGSSDLDNSLEFGGDPLAALVIVNRVERFGFNRSVVQRVAVALAHDAIRLSLDCVVALRCLLHGANHFVAAVKAEPAGRVVGINAAFDRIDRLFAARKRAQDASAIAVNQNVFRQPHVRHGVRLAFTKPAAIAHPFDCPEIWIGVDFALDFLASLGALFLEPLFLRPLHGCHGLAQEPRLCLVLSL